MKTFAPLKLDRIQAILDRVQKVRCGLVGDLCLDIYWRADMRRSRLSRETPHYILPVVEEWHNPGGAANVAANLAALKAAAVYPLGVIGSDWRGDLLLSHFPPLNLSRKFVIRHRDRFTTTFAKPLRFGYGGVEYEDPRIEFDNYQPLPAKEEKEILVQLERLGAEVDVLCVAEYEFSWLNQNLRKEIVHLGKQLSVPVVADSREHISDYAGAVLKTNELEAFRALFSEKEPEPNLNLTEKANLAELLAEKTGSCVCLTAGPAGAFWVEKKECWHIPAVPVSPPLDIVGAGDTFLSAFSLSLATGASGPEAAAFANRAAAVVVKKLKTTGVATPEEMLLEMGYTKPV